MLDRSNFYLAKTCLLTRNHSINSCLYPVVHNPLERLVYAQKCYEHVAFRCVIMAFLKIEGSWSVCMMVEYNLASHCFAFWAQPYKVGGLSDILVDLLGIWDVLWIFVVNISSVGAFKMETMWWEILSFFLATVVPPCFLSTNQALRVDLMKFVLFTLWYHFYLRAA